MVEPARIGIVDMGSNAIRFLIAEAIGSEYRTIESHRTPVRLGESVFRTGRIPESDIAASADAFRRFRVSCDRLSVQCIRAVATSAMREAKNCDELVDRVRGASQLEIDVISGAEEAYLLKLGVETQVDLSSGRSLLVDVGGGSVEVVVVENGGVESAHSYRLGALRLREMFRDAACEQLLSLVHQHLDGLNDRFLEQIKGGTVDRCVGVGGNIECLSDLITARLLARQVRGIEACKVTDLADEVVALAQMTVDERVERRKLRPDRADTIVPAGAVYHHLAKLVDTQYVLVPRTGLTQGLLLDA